MDRIWMVTTDEVYDDEAFESIRLFSNKPAAEQFFKNLCKYHTIPVERYLTGSNITWEKRELPSFYSLNEIGAWTHNHILIYLEQMEVHDE